MTSHQFIVNNRTITDQFVDDLYELTHVKFDRHIYKQAKKSLLDYLGVTIAGVQIIKSKTDELFDNIVQGSGNISLIGLNESTGVLEAALINGIHSHVAELDDGERFGMFHPGAPIFSALLPATQKYNINETQFFKGVIIGYEAAIRLARALQPALKDKGFHCTGICGSVGAAIATGVALNFTKQQINDTLSAAATSASGLLTVIKRRSEMKPYNVGIAAQNGLCSALLVKSGFEGTDNVLDGDMGFLMAFTGKFEKEQLFPKKNEPPAIMGIYMKPYAACRHCHPPIEAAIILKNKHNLETGDIKSVNIHTYYWAVSGHDHTEIVNINSAKMSIPFSVAVAIHTGSAGIQEFSDNYIKNEEIKRLTEKINIYINDELTALVPRQRGAIVEIRTNNELFLVERVDYPKGEPETPLTVDEIRKKFLSLSEYAGFDYSISQQIVECIMSQEINMNKLFYLLQAGKK